MSNTSNSPFVFFLPPLSPSRYLIRLDASCGVIKLCKINREGGVVVFVVIDASDDVARGSRAAADVAAADAAATTLAIDSNSLSYSPVVVVIVIFVAIMGVRSSVHLAQTGRGGDGGRTVTQR